MIYERSSVAPDKSSTLPASDQFYRQLVNAANLCIWVLDPQTQTKFVNPQMAKLLGYSVNEMLGKPAANFIEADNPGLAKAHSRKLLADVQTSFDFELKRKDGSCIWVNISLSPLFDESRRRIGTLALVAEITAVTRWRERMMTSGLVHSHDA